MLLDCRPLSHGMHLRSPIEDGRTAGPDRVRTHRAWTCRLRTEWGTGRSVQLRTALAKACGLHPHRSQPCHSRSPRQVLTTIFRDSPRENRVPGDAGWDAYLNHHTIYLRQDAPYHLERSGYTYCRGQNILRHRPRPFYRNLLH